MNRRLQHLLPILDWAPRYTRGEAASDLFAAVIVTTGIVIAGVPATVGVKAPATLL